MDIFEVVQLQVGRPDHVEEGYFPPDPELFPENVAGISGKVKDAPHHQGVKGADEPRQEKLDVFGLLLSGLALALGLLPEGHAFRPPAAPPGGLRQLGPCVALEGFSDPLDLTLHPGDLLPRRSNKALEAPSTLPHAFLAELFELVQHARGLGPESGEPVHEGAAPRPPARRRAAQTPSFSLPRLPFPSLRVTEGH